MYKLLHGPDTEYGILSTVSKNNDPCLESVTSLVHRQESMLNDQQYRSIRK